MGKPWTSHSLPRTGLISLMSVRFREGTQWKREKYCSKLYVLFCLLLCGRVAQLVQRLSYGLHSLGIVSRWGEIFRTCPDWPWGPPSLLYNGYRVFPRGKVRLGRAAGHSPHSSAAVMEEQSYISTHPLGHNRTCNGNTLLYLTLLFNSMAIKSIC